MFERGREWTWQLERGDGSWPDDEEHQRPVVEHTTREIVTCRTTDVKEVQHALAARFECVPDDLERRWWPTTWIATSKGLYMTDDRFPAEWERRVAGLKDDNMLPMVLAAHPRKQREQKDFEEAGWTREVTHVADAWCIYDTAGAELDRHDMQLCFDAERGLVSGGGLDVDGHERHFTAFAFGDAPSLSDLW